MRSFVVILAALVFLAVAALHGYRIYAAVPVAIAGHGLPVVASWYGGAGAALLGVLLLLVGRK